MTTELEDFCAATAGDLLVLAGLHREEINADKLAEMKRLNFPDALAFRLQSEFGRQALSLLSNALGELPEQPDAAVIDELAVDYASIYLNNSFGAFPAESVWIDEDSLTMQEPMFQIREWYRKYELAVPDWRARSDDHLVHQLEFISHLLSDGGENSLADVARFSDEHLLRWIVDFARRVASRCDTPLYAGLVSVTAAYVDELRDVLALILEEPRPTREEIDERMRPKVEVAVAAPQAYVPGTAPSW